MEEKNVYFRDDRFLVVFFYVLLTVFLGYLILSQTLLPRDKTTDLTKYEEFDSHWIISYNNSEEEISLPADYDFEKGEIVTIINNLPENMADYNAMLIWSDGLYIRVYLDGELIFDLDNSTLPKIGNDNPYWYVWVDLPYGSEGKEIRIEQMADKDYDAGYLGRIYIGEKLSLFKNAIFPYLSEIIFALVVVFLGFVCVIAGFFLWHANSQPDPLIYMGTSVGLVAIWILANSNGRQFVVNNASSIRNVAFLVVPFFPIAFLFFLDLSQKRRYHRIYHAIEGISLLDFILAFTLHILGIKGLSETFTPALVICLATIVICLFTMIFDIKEGKISDYKWSSIGILFFGISAVIQILDFKFSKSYTTSGVYLLFGLFMLVIFSVINAVKSVQKMQDERIHALVKVKEVSIEAMEAIAKTVDAKDTYTAEHSERVAAYTLILAKELGATPVNLHNLRYGALLHDIGKIGIPDAVLNKPGKLTDEEYALIKTHTVIGSEIMKKVTTFPNADAIARHHHERYDGKGYPDGLKGESIPREARIVCIADSYDAMNLKRCYRPELTREKIREELVKGRGTQFDPDYLDVFLKLFDSGKLDEVEKTLNDGE